VAVTGGQTQGSDNSEKGQGVFHLESLKSKKMWHSKRQKLLPVI
jgi:hypothetical protein